MSIIDRVLKSYNDKGRRRIEVPEWPDDEKNPTILYSTPCTLAEKNLMLKQAGKESKDLKCMAWIVCRKAELENGEKAFKMSEVHDLARGGEADVISRIAQEITDWDSVEDSEKN